MTLQRNDLVDFDDVAAGEGIPPTHPGVILREEFLQPLGISAYRLAKAIDVPKNRITGIVNGERALTSDTALRLARFFGTTAEFWVNLQSHYDLEMTRHEHGDEILRTVEPRQGAEIRYA